MESNTPNVIHTGWRAGQGPRARGQGPGAKGVERQTTAHCAAVAHLMSASPRSGDAPFLTLGPWPLALQPEQIRRFHEQPVATSLQILEPKRPRLVHDTSVTREDDRARERLVGEQEITTEDVQRRSLGPR